MWFKSSQVHPVLKTTRGAGSGSNVRRCWGITRVGVDEGEDVDARPRAARIEHHRIEDVAVVRRTAEAGEDSPGAAGQIQERVDNLGLAEACNSVQNQEKKSPVW